MEWAMLASLLAPYLIQAFSGGGGSDLKTPADAETAAQQKALREMLMQQLTLQNTRTDRRDPLDAQIVQLAQQLMPNLNMRPNGPVIETGPRGPSVPGGPPPITKPTPQPRMPGGPEPEPEPTPSPTGAPGRYPIPKGPQAAMTASPDLMMASGANQNLPDFMFPGWLDQLPTYKKKTQGRTY